MHTYIIYMHYTYILLARIVSGENILFKGGLLLKSNFALIFKKFSDAR